MEQHPVVDLCKRTPRLVAAIEALQAEAAFLAELRHDLAEMWRTPGLLTAVRGLSPHRCRMSQQIAHAVDAADVLQAIGLDRFPTSVIRQLPVVSGNRVVDHADGVVQLTEVTAPEFIGLYAHTIDAWRQESLDIRRAMVAKADEYRERCLRAGAAPCVPDDDLVAFRESPSAVMLEHAARRDLWETMATQVGHLPEADRAPVVRIMMARITQTPDDGRSEELLADLREVRTQRVQAGWFRTRGAVHADTLDFATLAMESLFARPELLVSREPLANMLEANDVTDLANQCPPEARVPGAMVTMSAEEVWVAATRAVADCLRDLPTIRAEFAQSCAAIGGAQDPRDAERSRYDWLYHPMVHQWHYLRDEVRVRERDAATLAARAAERARWEAEHEATRVRREQQHERLAAMLPGPIARVLGVRKR